VDGDVDVDVGPDVFGCDGGGGEALGESEAGAVAEGQAFTGHVGVELGSGECVGVGEGDDLDLGRHEPRRTGLPAPMNFATSELYQYTPSSQLERSLSPESASPWAVPVAMPDSAPRRPGDCSTMSSQPAA